MPVVMAGAEARTLAAELAAGSVIRLSGALRSQGGRLGPHAAGAGVEVAAQAITLEANGG